MSDSKDMIVYPDYAEHDLDREGNGISRRLLVFVLCVMAVAVVSLGTLLARNELVAIDVLAETQWGQVENQLLRQYELLPKLALVAKRYAEHERTVLADLTDSRSRYLAASPRERPALANAVDQSLASVLLLVESYPGLKADRQYRDLAFEIAGTKNRIAVERGRYNEVVGQLNTRLRQVPWKLFAFEIVPREYLDVASEQLVEPALDI
jgi:LemA protein